MQSRSLLMLAFPGVQILDVTGPLQMFARVNDELGHAAYRIIARLRRSELYGDRYREAHARTDTLIAAGGNEQLRAILAVGEVTRILSLAKDRVRRIASVCSGTFFLAAAGLLDGRRAATHWNAVAQLRQFRPQIEVDADAIHIEDGGIWTSAGVTAGIDLALAMIEADHGREVALAVARRHVVYRIRPGGQSQFSAELAGQSASDKRLARLTESVLAAPSASWNVERLAEEAGLSLRSLSRRFRRELNASPAAFVERVRVDAARRALLETNASIEAVARECGFGSLRRMDRAFARILRVSPSEFRSLFKTNGCSSWPSKSVSSSSPISLSSI